MGYCWSEDGVVSGMPGPYQRCLGGLQGHPWGCFVVPGSVCLWCCSLPPAGCVVAILTLGLKHCLPEDIHSSGKIGRGVSPELTVSM